MAKSSPNSMSLASLIFSEFGSVKNLVMSRAESEEPRSIFEYDIE